MPKGRGSNKRRSRRQKDSEWIRERLGRGAVKLHDLGKRAELVAKERRKRAPIAAAIARRRKASDKAKRARIKARKEWA